MMTASAAKPTAGLAYRAGTVCRPNVALARSVADRLRTVDAVADASGD
jgi:hypothetical protein